MMEKEMFRHSINIRVRNYEVDWQGIVHNSNYLRYCEVGRIEYLRDIGATIDITAINSGSRVVLVRNEIDYIAPARFDDMLTVWTRISGIRNSSFIMEGFVERLGSSERIAENVAFHAWLHPQHAESIRVPDEFRDLVRSFEGERCMIGLPAERTSDFL